MQAALEDSKQAVTLAEERLVKKDGKIVKLENQVEEFQGNEIKLEDINATPGGSLCPPLSMRHSSQEFVIQRPLQNTSKVLQVVLTPLQNRLTAHHTKTSLLRLKNSPMADKTRKKDLIKRPLNVHIANDKENVKVVKRKVADRSRESLNTSKRRRVSNSVKRKLSRLSGKSLGAKYNLRNRR